MGDIFLQEMMKIKVKKEEPKKTKYDLSLEQQLKEYVEKIEVEKSPHLERELTTVAQRRKRLEEEIKRELAEMYSWLEPHIKIAMQIIKSGEKLALDSKENQLLIDEFATMDEKFKQMEMQDTLSDDWTSNFSISDSCIEALIKEAHANFLAKNFNNCLALFALLSIQVPGEFEFWFRMGIAAHEMEDFDLALRAYTIAAALNPNEIGPRLLAAECHLRCERYDAAETEYLKAKEIKEISGNSEVDENWELMLKELENFFQKI